MINSSYHCDKFFGGLLMRIKWLVVMMFVFALVAAGCSSDDADTTTAAETTTTADTTTSDDAATDSGDAAEPAGTGYSIAFIFDLFVDDGGWNSTFGRAVDEVEAAYPGLDIQRIEEIGPGTATTNTAEDLAAEGVDIVVATYFSQFDIADVAAQYPDTVFLTWAGFETAENMGHFDAATEDGRYLDGIVAGSTLEDGGTIGYVAGFPIEEVNRALNAFALGVQSVNPDAIVEAVYINSWYDPPVEQQAAEALVNSGAGMLGHELNSPAVATVAQDRELNVVGYTSDRSTDAPDAWLTSFQFEWGSYFIDQVQSVIDGAWTAELTYGGLAEGMIGNAPYGPAVTDDVIALVDEARAAIIDGSLDYFAGPLVDNEGNMIIGEGETIPFGERSGCCLWLIQGIEGSVS
jgi:basic membrane protein A